jgi:hypothetical protein
MPEQFEDFLQARKNAQEVAKREMKEFLSRTFSLYAVDTITVDYDGSGDSGEIQDVRFEAVGAEIVIPDPAYKEKIMGFCYELLPGGWEINEGSYGTLVIHCKTMHVEHTHNERVESVETSETEFEL